MLALKQTLRDARAYLRLPPPARAEHQRDRARQLGADPGIETAVREAVAWLGRAQDRSASRDGGVARDFSLIDGWSTSYPETTGYIVPTMLHCAELWGDAELRERARRMLDWLVSIQLPGGGFQGGTIGATPVVPVTFNTGQILIGLADGARGLGDAYVPAMHAAATWLTDTQDPDGCWRKHATPFATYGEKAYETHVAWGLLEAARVAPDTPYAEAALRNVRWALGSQRPNGWFDNCCLTDTSQPLTHTLGYVLRGVLEAWRFSGDQHFLEAGRRTADGLRSALREDGFLPGRLDSGWNGAVDWACLTGSVQIAHCWLMLYQDTGEAAYRDAAYAANRYARRTVQVQGDPDVRGGVKGSFPVFGEYGRYQYLNWACKFFIDANLLEQSVRDGEAP